MISLVDIFFITDAKIFYQPRTEDIMRGAHYGAAMPLCAARAAILRTCCGVSLSLRYMRNIIIMPPIVFCWAEPMRRYAVLRRRRLSLIMPRLLFLHTLADITPLSLSLRYHAISQYRRHYAFIAARLCHYCNTPTAVTLVAHYRAHAVYMRHVYARVGVCHTDVTRRSSMRIWGNAGITLRSRVVISRQQYR